MKNGLLKDSILVGAFVASVALFPALASASTVERPTLLFGQTTVTDSDGVNYYGGFTGNEAIYNDYNTQVNLAFDRANLSAVDSCYSDITKLVRCFSKSFDSPPTAMDILTSRTYITGNSVPKLEFSALLYAQNSVVGDVYGYLNNFSLWGRNLAESQSSNLMADGTWNVSGYTLNPQAQSSWFDSNGAETDSIRSYRNKVETMKGEATEISEANLVGAVTPIWYLQNKGPMITSDDLVNKDPAAEGKVWYVNGDLNISGREIQYKEKGTIIVGGNLTITDSTILPAIGDGNSLGFIVYGDIKFQGHGTVHAPMFSFESFDMTGASTLELIGSFVAKTFSDTSSNRNVRIVYDVNLSKNWPPGFRYLGNR